MSYTYAKAISDNTNDNASTNTDPWNTFGNDDRGLDENDRRHAFSLSVIAPLPWGIQLATIVSLRNGNPWDVTAGVDLDRDGNNQDRPAGLVKNAGGREDEGNLAIINAFRQSRNLSPITHGAAGAHLRRPGGRPARRPSSSCSARGCGSTCSSRPTTC